MDFDSLFSSANGALGLIRGSIDLGKQIRQLVSNAPKGGVPVEQVAELSAQLHQKLVDAQLAQLTLTNALLETKTQMIQAERRLDLQARYQPHWTGGGALVLVAIPDDNRLQAPHYICPDCAEKGIRSFLQPRGTGKQCNPCGTFFPFSGQDPAAGLSTGFSVTDPYGD